MPEPVNTEETRIKALLENWADAVRRHDLPAILAHHEPGLHSSEQRNINPQSQSVMKGVPLGRR